MSQTAPIKHALPVLRQDDFAQWYQAVIAEAELAEESGVRGCMVIKPWGYGIWERIQKLMDERIKEAGVDNCYFPLFIPLSYFTREAAHVEGFGELFGGVADAVLHRWREAEGRDDAGAVAGVDAGLFDVLHDGADDGRFAVADAIDIDLGGVFEEAVDEDGVAGGDDGFVCCVGVA